MKYNFWSSLLKAVVKGSAFALPLVVPMLPKAWMDVSFGTALYMFVDFLQKKYTSL